MKPFDIKGEYTPEEVKAALAGTSGTRQLSYRYERLDRFNNFVEDIDYVQSCSIENNGLADIKRTAKMDILDSGSINYLQDRIKPYVRLAIPHTEDYTDYLKTLDPTVWWKMDEGFRAKPTTVALVPLADGNTYTTRETAYAFTSVATTRNSWSAKVDTDDPAHRDTVWFAVTVNTSEPLVIDIGAGGGASTVTVQLAYAPASDQPLEILGTSTIAYSSFSRYSYAVPRRGIYYASVVPTTADLKTPTLTVYREAIMEDSSGKGNTGFYTLQSTVMGKEPLITDNGMSISGTQPLWGTGYSEIELTAPFTKNLWVNYGNDVFYEGDFDFEFGSVAVDVHFYCNNGVVNYNLIVDDLDNNVHYTHESPALASEVSFDSHLLSVVFDPASGFAGLYYDGKLAYQFPASDGTTSLTQFAGALLDKTCTYTDFYIYSDAVDGARADDMTIFPTALSSPVLSKMHYLGLNSVSGRSGYVEWPQGVFLLSSPSRKMVNGNHVVRAVDGYDQLVTLKEDSFDYRYSVDKNINYTAAIDKVLQTTAPYESFNLNDSRKILRTTTNAAVLTDDSFKVTSPGGAGAYGILGTFALADLSAEAKATLPASGVYESFLAVNCFPDGREGTMVALAMYVEAGQTVIGYKGIGVGFTFDSVAHAYWRIRESRSYIYWEVSPDGATWTQLHVVRADFDTACEADLIMGQVSATVGQITTFSKLKVNGYQRIKSSIIKTASVLPAVMEWEPGTSKLTIINDLLGAVNYESATYDEDGVFVGRPYITPQNRTAQFGYATDAESVITGDVNQSMDLFKIPNKWIIVVSEPDRTPLTGTYTNSDPLSPTSTVSRGRTIVEFRTEQNAPDQVTLDAQAARLAFEASQVYEVIEFNTALMPIHQNMDVFNLTIDGLEVANKYAEQSWSMTLANGATMTHRVRKVVSI